jgi:hypothetical protein
MANLSTTVQGDKTGRIHRHPLGYFTITARLEDEKREAWDGDYPQG